MLESEVYGIAYKCQHMSFEPCTYCLKVENFPKSSLEKQRQERKKKKKQNNACPNQDSIASHLIEITSTYLPSQVK